MRQKSRILWIPLVAISFFVSCGYTFYGATMGQKKSSTLAGKDQPGVYKADTYSGPFPKSIIFIISDGTGIGQYTTLYYASDDFAPARFDHVGLISTHPLDGKLKVTDSAAGGTALATGQKTFNGAISVDTEKQPLKTALEWAEEKGMATGLVATSTISHATPATFATHVDSRHKEDEIARQLAESEVDVLFGGGLKHWEPEWISKIRSSGGQVISDIHQSVNPLHRVVGLFADDALPAAHEGRNPTTQQMAEKAIHILEHDPEGFFIMIEESQVDWGGHANSAEYIFGEMESLNQVVKFCLDYQTDHPEILVILTADHETGGCSVSDGENGELDIRFTGDLHTASFVPVWATGPGSEAFDAFMDNTEIGRILIQYIQK